MNRLKRKFKSQPTSKKPNVAEPGWNGMYHTGQRFDPSADTLCVDPARAQPPYPNVLHHMYAGPAGQSAYYQQPGTILMPVQVIPTLTGMPHPDFAPEHPHLNPLNTSFGTQGVPHGANIAVPITSRPSSLPSTSQEDHRRDTTNASAVPDLPLSPTSTVSSRQPRALHSPQPSTSTALSISDLKSLQRYDLVLLVSDSSSMDQGGKWQKCGELLTQLARIAMQYDRDGIEIHFLNTDSERSDDNFSSEEDVESMFQSVASPEGSSRLSDKLDLLVSEYRGQLKRYIDSNPAKPWRLGTFPKKAIYVVLTDGNHADTRKIVGIIADMAGFLKTLQAPSTQFGIEFVQIGEPSDFEWLHRAIDQDEKVRGIVGIDAYNGGTLETIQLGSTNAAEVCQ
ncbi:hypothetical protein FRC08_002346 [Ceratobasidium sp. 394]|nr:hypothetical protein FRC08_002346 [Ceratobasidium sp. 394]